jgi:hypothetical protein
VRTFQAATLTELHDLMCRTLIEAPKSDLDVISTVDVQIHDVIGQADSMDWEFDLKDMWLTKSRWTMMVNQYIDPEEFQAWLNQITSKIGTKGRGICVMRTKTVKARGGEATGHTNKETRRWGSCMLALSYKAVPTPTITLHSRTSYLGYIGALDLTVAWMAAKTLADAMGVDVKTFKFIWMNEAIQWHNFKSLAFLLNHPDEKRRKAYRRLMIKPLKKLKPKEIAQLEASPALTLSRKWLAKVIKEDKDGVTYGDMTYNTYRRIRRRWHTEVHGLEYAEQFEGWSRWKAGEKKGKKKEFFKAYKPLPSTPASTLAFDSLTKKGVDLKGAEFQGGGLEDDDDDE